MMDVIIFIIGVAFVILVITCAFGLGSRSGQIVEYPPYQDDGVPDMIGFLDAEENRRLHGD